MADVYDIDGDGTMNEAETNSKITIELAFKRFDEDGSGYIDANELSNLIDSLDADGDMSPEDVEKALNELDSDGSGRIEKSEFIQWWLDLNGTGDSDSALRKRLRNLAKQGRKRLGTDIHKAAWEGNLDVVQAFVSTRSSLVNEDDDTDHGDKYRPLHYAAYQGHEDVCKYLMSKGAKINVQTGSGCTPLFFASQQGRTAIVRLLLNHRASAAIVEKECGLGPVDVADNDTIRGLFKTVGKYSRPDAPVEVKAGVTTSNKKKINSRDGVLTEVRWIHDPNSRSKSGSRQRGAADEALPVSGFLVKVLDEETDTEIRLIDVPKAFNEDGDNDETTHRCRVRLPEGSTYIFRVAAVNGLGRSKYSDSSLEVDVGLRPDAPVTTPTIVDLKPTSVTISWEIGDGDGDGARGVTPNNKLVFVVEQRRAGDSDAWMKRDRGTSSSTSVPRPADSKFKKVQEVRPGNFNTFCTLDRLTTGSLYEIRLYMRNESGAGAPGKIVSFETPMFGNKTKKSKTLTSRKGRVGALGRQALREQKLEENEMTDDYNPVVHHIEQ